MHRALPIVSLRLHSPTQHLTLGTLSTDRADFGRDRTTPHGLLPPLATETLWFTRAYEAGVQWQVRTPKVAHEVWYNYQKLNTPEHREKFDVGITGRLPISGPATAAYQIHLVHHGGELYENGLVSDSLAYGPGLILRGTVRTLDALSLEVFGLAAHDRPDRAVSSGKRTTSGAALFVRAAAERNGWRGHLIVWRGTDFNHELAGCDGFRRLIQGEPTCKPRPRPSFESFHQVVVNQMIGEHIRGLRWSRVDDQVLRRHGGESWTLLPNEPEREIHVTQRSSGGDDSS